MLLFKAVPLLPCRQHSCPDELCSPRESGSDYVQSEEETDDCSGDESFDVQPKRRGRPVAGHCKQFAAAAIAVVPTVHSPGGCFICTAARKLLCSCYRPASGHCDFKALTGSISSAEAVCSQFAAACWRALQAICCAADEHAEGAPLTCISAVVGTLGQRTDGETLAPLSSPVKASAPAECA